ncbi:hypothetical protein PVAP13_1NG141800, partial [Panicum virgatum]
SKLAASSSLYLISIIHSLSRSRPPQRRRCERQRRRCERQRRPATAPPRPPPSRCSSPPPSLTPHRNRSTGEEGWRGEERRPRLASRSRAARGAVTGERKRSGGGAWVQSAWVRAGERRGRAGVHGPERGGRVIIEAGIEEVEEGVGREGLAVVVDVGGGASGADQSRVGELVAAVAAGRHGPERGGHVVVEAGVEEVEEGFGREGLAVGIGRAASGACGRAAHTKAAVASWRRRPAPLFFDFFYVS